MYVPRYMFFTKGVGTHKEKLVSFENALREARIAHLNLVRVSSIFPPHCNIIDIETGLAHLEPGEITHCVLAQEQTDEPGRRIVASIGLALPAEDGRYGYLSEHHGFGQTEFEAEGA